MRFHGINESFAGQASDLAVGITDDRHTNYNRRVSNWMISNPEGYAKWFENRMNTVQLLKAACESAQVDDVPMYRQKTPLQRVVQILKRHRDQMFVDNQDSKPISVIITTLSAKSYTGASSLTLALKDVLNGLIEFIKSDSSQVLNPVNPEENFADRWSMSAYKHLKLKQNFYLWVQQVNRDFEFILSSNELDLISESVNGNFAIALEKSALSSMLAIPVGAEAAHTTHVVSEPVSKPWSKGRGEICK
jgi:hypothetical protein